jgi:bile acid:Na+ symporter, BASS family
MSTTTLILIALKTSIILTVFSIGLRATPAQAGYLFRRPLELLRAVVTMNVLMPAVAFALAMWFDLPPAVKIALVVLAVSPTPPIFPKKAFKAGGSEDYVIGLVTAAAALSCLVIPISIEVFRRVTERPLTLASREVAVLAATSILLPLLVGIALAHFAPRLVRRIVHTVEVGSTWLMVLAAVPILFVVARPMWSLLTDGSLLGMAAFVGIGLILGHNAGHRDPHNRPVLALATISRHPGIAVAIAHANFPEQRLAVAAVLLYLIVNVIASALYLTWVRPHHVDSAPHQTGQRAA